MFERAGIDQPQRYAAALIVECGSLGGVLAAPRQRLLRAVPDNRAAVREVQQFRTTMMHALRFNLSKGPLLSYWSDIEDYLRAKMSHLPVEQVRVLYLSTTLRLLKDDLVSSGTIDQANVYVREIIGRALAIGAQGMIMVHNHPSGDPTPSRPDRTITRDLAHAARAVGMKLFDHIIVSDSGLTSMRGSELM